MARRKFFFPSLAASDSTLQQLLWLDGSGKSYGEDVEGWHSIICPGKPVIMQKSGLPQTPPILEVLAWRIICILGERPTIPVGHSPFLDALYHNFHEEIFVRLITLRTSLLPQSSRRTTTGLPTCGTSTEWRSTSWLIRPS